MRANQRLYLGPDNGLLSWVDGAEQAVVWVLDRNELFNQPVSSTFHGRDVFASVAGHLAAGIEPEACGSLTASWQRLPWPEVRRLPGEMVGEVVHVDRFGNLVTNIAAALLRPVGSWNVRWRDQRVGPIRSTFGDVDRGQWLAYLGSGSMLELAVRDGSAAAVGGKRGDEVTLCRVV